MKTDVNSEVIEISLGNYYGMVEFLREGENYFIQLKNYSSWNKKSITKEFFEAAKKEFSLATTEQHYPTLEELKTFYKEHNTGLNRKNF